MNNEEKQQLYDELWNNVNYYEHHKYASNRFEDLYHIALKLLNSKDVLWSNIRTMD